MTTKRLEILTTEWKRRLRLQDWETAVSFEPRDKINGDGQTLYNAQLKTAKISIITEETYQNPTGTQPYDPEEILVHELLHLPFAGIDKFKGLAYTQFEVAIDLIAMGLVKAKRGE